MVTEAQVREALDAKRKEMPFSAAIRWEVEVGLDATGDRAVWVWTIIDDARIDEVWPMHVRDAIRSRVDDAVTECAGEDVLVYVRFRLESEQQKIVREGESA